MTKKTPTPLPANLYRRGTTGKIWYCLQHKGKRIRRSTGTNDVTLAVDKLAEARVKLARGESLSPPAKRKTILFRDFVDVHYLPIFIGTPTERSCRTRCKTLCKTFGDEHIADITDGDIRAHFLARRAAGIQDNTLNTERDRAISLFAAAVKDGYIKTNPVTIKAFPRESRMRFLTDEEKTSLLAALTN